MVRYGNLFHNNDIINDDRMTEEIKEIDLGEYIVKITYSGDGKLDIDVFDQLGEQIEGIYISNDI